jgi:hypothetical protein
MTSFEAMVSAAQKTLECEVRTQEGARHALRWMQIGGIWTQGDRARAEALRRIIVANKTQTV